jgi:hypothetical protein
MHLMTTKVSQKSLNPIRNAPERVEVPNKIIQTHISEQDGEKYNHQAR